jgi:hypothetical protein
MKITNKHNINTTKKYNISEVEAQAKGLQLSIYYSQPKQIF